MVLQKAAENDMGGHIRNDDVLRKMEAKMTFIFRIRKRQLNV